MKQLQAFAFGFALLSWVGCQCTTSTNLCDGVKCDVGLHCNGNTGMCVVGAGGSSGGAGGGAAGGSGGSTGGAGGGNGPCSPACSGATPVCEVVPSGAAHCVTCTTSEGCTAPTAFCDPTAGAAGTCYECVLTSDCPNAGQTCDPVSHTCTGGGTGGGAGQVVWDDAGMTVHCLGSDAGPTPCTTTCHEGFQCINGACVLNGASGPVQVTLRFPQDEDLDLHVVEPLTDGGTCEVFYGAPNSPPDAGYIPFPCGSLPHCGANQVCLNGACINLPVTTCGATGWLDLDSNPACRIDGVDIENYIWPGHVNATRGTYIVRVDYYMACGSSPPIPYEVEVRANGQTRYYCGTFQPSDADNGSTGAGRTITSVVIQ